MHMRMWGGLLGLLLGACSKPTSSGVAVAAAPASASASAAEPEAKAATKESMTARGEEKQKGPPPDLNVILISVDSLRADMPWAGYPRDIAPNLTAFAKKGIDYARAYSISSYTSMSVGGLLGGRLPSELKRSGYFFGTYRDNVFFPKLLQNKGIYTAAVHSHAYFKSAGFEQGFDAWELVPKISFDAQTDRNVTSSQSEEIAERLLSDPRTEKGRFFFWVHFTDPHDLYIAHPGIGPYGKTDRDKYDAEVEFTDQHIGKLFRFIEGRPYASRTAIFVTSDHGEAFGEHQMTRHGFEIWENLVRVPLLVSIPGMTSRRIEVPRSGIDLAPTICELLGVAPDPAFSGKSLVPEFYGAEPSPRNVVVDLPMTSNNDRRRALISGKSKLLCFHDDAQCKLYDLEKDPGEDAPTQKGEQFGEMMTRYREVAKSVREVAPFACGASCLNNAYLKK